MPHHIRFLLKELAFLAESMVPEHGRATYGDPTRDLTPREIYNREEVEKALNYAKRLLRTHELF